MNINAALRYTIVSLTIMFYSNVVLSKKFRSSEVSQYMFVTYPVWVTLPGRVVDKNGRMIFRRYSMLFHKSGEFDLEYGLSNTMMFWCDRNGGDILVFHLHDKLMLQSFHLNSWKPKIDIHILTSMNDGLSSSGVYNGEYIKGDIFIDLTKQNYEDLIAVMGASEFIVDFGDKGDQLKFIVIKNEGEGKELYGLLENDIKRSILGSDDKRMDELTPVETKDMLVRCMKYRKTGL